MTSFITYCNIRPEISFTSMFVLLYSLNEGFSESSDVASKHSAGVDRSV